MSKIQLNHIQGEIERHIREKLDLSDLIKCTTEIKENTILSRSFALYALKCCTEYDYSKLEHSITDGFGDNGIDAVYFDEVKNILFIVQSKWLKAAQGGPDKGEILKFIKGIKDLISLDFENFNEKVKNKKDEIKKALYDKNIKIRIVLAYTGNKISPDSLAVLTDFLLQENDGEEVIYLEEFNLIKAHRCLTLGIEGEPIDVSFDLHNWGKNDEPLKLFYGMVSCSAIAEVFSKNKLRLFSQNIRGFMGEGEINDQIIKSLVRNPEDFFYLNNGITILAKKITKAAAGGSDRISGHFICEDVTVINGAQTVGSIFHATLLNKKQVDRASVFVRLISLENCPENFERLITIATNTQNKIEKKDFVSLDFNQHRLKTELLLEEINYFYKRDDNKTKLDNKTFNLEEATIALACMHPDIDMATTAKREIGRLWEDTNKPPYSYLFNSSLSGTTLVRAIKIHRKIEKSLRASEAWGLSEYEALVLIHGNYFISHLIFQNIEKSLLHKKEMTLDGNFEEMIEALTEKYKILCIDTFANLFRVKFPPTVFKNISEMRSLKEAIFNKEGKVSPGQTLSLFND